jgi:hypothetical protein
MLWLEVNHRHPVVCQTQLVLHDTVKSKGITKEPINEGTFLSPLDESEDVAAFLQGLVTNDVTGALPAWCGLLTPQGKVLFDSCPAGRRELLPTAGGGRRRAGRGCASVAPRSRLPGMTACSALAAAPGRCRARSAPVRAGRRWVGLIDPLDDNGDNNGRRRLAGVPAGAGCARGPRRATGKRCG